MLVKKTPIEGVLMLKPDVFSDERGFFLESWNAATFSQATGVDADFVQDNHSRSQRNVLRGLHFQIEQPQGKLVRVVRGAVFDVVVDLRASSPTFGRWYGIELNEMEQIQLWIPPGCAHGFYVRSDSADFLYKTTAFYSVENQRCIRWNDPALGIDWRLPMEPLVSVGDAGGGSLSDVEVYP